MKKRNLLTIVLILSLVLSLTACGGSAAPKDSGEQTAASSEEAKPEEKPAEAKEETKEETNEETGASFQQMDVAEEFKYEYDEDIVLMETENVRITAKRLTYKKTDNGMVLDFTAGIQNFTDDVIKARTKWNTTEDHLKGGNAKSEAGGNGNFRLAGLYDWNGLMGETEDCYQGTCQMTITSNDQVIDTVQFDLYTSQKTPFVNIEVGAQFSSDEEDPGNTEPQEAKEPADKASDEEMVVHFYHLTTDNLTRVILLDVASELGKDGITLIEEEYPDYDPINYLMNENGPGVSMCISMTGQKSIDGVSPVGYTTCVPINLYSSKYQSPEEIQKEDTVALYGMNILTNPRIQTILEAAGLISLKNGPSEELKEDEIEYHAEFFNGKDYNAVISNLPNLGAALLPGDADAVGMDPIFTDPTIENEEYWNTLVARTEDTKDPAKLEVIEKVVNAFHSQEMLKYYEPALTNLEPVGWDIDLISQYK